MILLSVVLVAELPVAMVEMLVVEVVLGEPNLLVVLGEVVEQQVLHFKVDQVQPVEVVDIMEVEEELHILVVVPMVQVVVDHHILVELVMEQPRLQVVLLLVQMDLFL